MEYLECNKHKIPVAIICAHPNCEEILLCDTCLRKHSSQHLKYFYTANIFSKKAAQNSYNNFIATRHRVSAHHDKLKERLKSLISKSISNLRSTINKEIDQLETNLISFLYTVNSFEVGKSILRESKSKMENILDNFSFDNTSDLKSKISSFTENYEEFNSLLEELKVPFDIYSFNFEFQVKYCSLKENIMNSLDNSLKGWNETISKYSYRNFGCMTKSQPEAMGKVSEKLTAITYDMQNNFVVVTSTTGIHFYRILPNMTLLRLHYKKIKDGEVRKIKWIEDENIYILAMRNGQWRKFDYQSSLLSPGYDFEEEILDLDYCEMEKILIILGSVECKMYYIKRITPKLALTLTNANTQANFSCLTTTVNRKSTLVVVGLDNGWIHFLNLSNPEIVFKHQGHTRRVTSVCFTINTKLLLSSSEDLSTKYWNISDEGKITCVKVFKSDFYRKVFILNDRFLVVFKGNNRNFELRNANNSKRISQKKIDNSIKDIVYVPNLSMLFYICDSGIYNIRL